MREFRLPALIVLALAACVIAWLVFRPAQVSPQVASDRSMPSAADRPPVANEPATDMGSAPRDSVTANPAPKPDIEFSIVDDEGKPVTDPMILESPDQGSKAVETAGLPAGKVVYVASPGHLTVKHSVLKGKNEVVLPRLAALIVTLESGKLPGTFTECERISMSLPDGMYEPAPGRGSNARRIFNRENGKAVFSALCPYAEYEIRFQRGKLRMCEHVKMTLAPGEVVSVTMTEAAIRKFTGRVVDPIGSPIEGANLHITVWLNGSGGGVASVTSDVEGRFELLEPEAAFFENNYNEKRYMELTCSFAPEPSVLWLGNRRLDWISETADLGDLVLGDGAKFEGQVLLDGKPRAGTRISAWQSGRSGEVITGDDGRFSIVGFDATRGINYQVEQEDYQHVSGSFRPDQHDGTPLRFDLKRKARGMVRFVLPANVEGGALYWHRPRYRGFVRVSVQNGQESECEPGNHSFCIVAGDQATRLEVVEIADQQTFEFKPVFMAAGSLGIPRNRSGKKVIRVGIVDMQERDFCTALPDPDADEPVAFALPPDLPFIAIIRYEDGKTEEIRFPSGLASGETRSLAD